MQAHRLPGDVRQSIPFQSFAGGITLPAPFTVTWFVPTVPVGNNFLAQIHFNYAVAGFNRNDLQLRLSDGTVTTLTGTRSTLVRGVGGIYNLSVTLSGTLDDDYFLRLRANRVTVDGELAPDMHIDSELFRITSGTLPNYKATHRNQKVPHRNQKVPVRAV